ncbi:MAG: hypothetical protein NDI61_13095 [Bdellovibrionaceae bacterium]|nr:hypothetical protein [Pseudobdellovibrionaceae bacterium]
MKNLKWFLSLALVSFLVPTLAPDGTWAAKYDYLCESDEDGEEGLCLAEPTDVPPKKKKTSAIAAAEESEFPNSVRSIAGQNARRPRVIFGAVNENGEDELEGLPSQLQKGSTAAAQAMRAQETIRQVETFLQNTKGPQGGLGTSEQGPIKAGQ